MKKQLHFTLIIGLLMQITCIAQSSNLSNTKDQVYNILWIVADDLGTDLGSYGNDLIHTPNLDQLASESVQYTNLNTVTAVCSPSRSALITGVYPVTIGLHQHRTRYKKEIPKGVLPITEYFKNAGYYVSNGSSKEIDSKGKTDYNFKHDFDKMYQGTHWRNRKKNQPFFSQIQISFPHRPFAKDPSRSIDPDQVELPPFYPDHELLRKDWALYLETIQLVDKQVGKIISDLKEDDLLDKTIIFFFGDQGSPHVRAKQFLYNSGTNTPLIIRWPNGKDAGSINNDLISNIDLPVVTLDLAKIPIPWYMPGNNFLKEKRHYIFTMRDRRDETVDRIRSVRDQRYKYIKNYYPEKPYMQANVYKDMRYPARPLLRLLNQQGKLNTEQLVFLKERPSEELYDLIEDPYEINNLASNPWFLNILSSMRKSLDTWVMEFDKGVYPEDQKEIDFALKEAMSRKKQMLDNRGLNSIPTDKEMVEYWMKRYELEN